MLPISMVKQVQVRRFLPCVILMLIVGCEAAHGHSSTGDSITDNQINWPGWEQFVRVLLLQDYNTRVVVFGTTLLGMAAGVVGTFAYLRGRAMMGDALSHATLPGVAAAFLILQDKNLLWLLVGATVSGVLGVLAVLGLRRVTRLKDDAAIGIVLSVFFGAGMVLFSLVQQMESGQQAGLGGFIYGKPAAMLGRDAWLIAGAAGTVIVGCVLFFKEMRVVCFDQAFAASTGLSVSAVDLLMMGMVVLTTVIGLQAVGLILIVALLIIPAASARFWTDGLLSMALIAGLFGAASGCLGSILSALMPRLPTGAIIVIVAGVLFFGSMIFAPHRGIFVAAIRRLQLRRRVADHHLLRALAEWEESFGANSSARFAQVLAERSWSSRSLNHVVERAKNRGWLDDNALPDLLLTTEGRKEARRVLRNHRLWELYLIQYADIAPSHVDRDADEIEHVLSETLVRELENELERTTIPPSPHTIRGGRLQDEGASAS
jgi:manganese/zinc/iron transport system permease protein